MLSLSNRCVSLYPLNLQSLMCCSPWPEFCTSCPWAIDRLLVPGCGGNMKGEELLHVE